MPINGNNNGQVSVTPLGNAQVFPTVSSVAGTTGYPAVGVIKGATLPYWFTGSGKPQTVYPNKQFPIGTMYTDLASTGGHIFFVFTPLSVANGVVLGQWSGVV